MGSFNEHIDQSIKNLEFLSNISKHVPNCWDWQVTVCFYAALHLINAHIIVKTENNYISHRQVDKVINPYNPLAVARLPESVYKPYKKLSQLSRRSRYLLHEDDAAATEGAVRATFTYSKHLKKALHHLQLIIDFMDQEYSAKCPRVTVKCIDARNLIFKNFEIVA